MKRLVRFAYVSVALLFAAAVVKDIAASWSEAPTTVVAARATPTAAPPPTPTSTPQWQAVEGDLPALRKLGKLRILAPQSLAGPSYLPRDTSPLDYQRDVAVDFARSLGLEAEILQIPAFDRVVPLLRAGKADLAAVNLIVTPGRKRRILFSGPFDRIRAQVVTRGEDTGLRTQADLSGRTLVVDPSTTFWGLAQGLRETDPSITVHGVPIALVPDVLDNVASGAWDTTILPSNILALHVAFRDDVRVAFDVSESLPIAWGVRPNAPRLRDALNHYLTRERMIEARGKRHRGDLDTIRERKVLRVLLRNNAVSYFLWRGELVGFEYDLLKRFADKLGLRLRVIVPPSHEDLFNWLHEGRGDIAAGFLSPIEQQDTERIAFAEPYHHAPQVLIARDDDPIASIEELAGREIVVRQESPYWEPLRRLRDEGADFELTAAANHLETEELIAGVAEGIYDLTVAGGPIADIAGIADSTALSGVRVAFPVGGPQPSAWAVRAASPQLRKAASEFIEDEYRGLFFNVTYNKYFRHQRDAAPRLESHLAPAGTGQISPWDDLVRKYADRYDFDWRLIVSQIYQESRFDPDTVSWAGAIGLMQVMPRTAEELGFADVRAPEPSVHAGVKYLAWLRERFDAELPFADRLWFALASYNAGLGHVLDARHLARDMGWDPDRWFENVENAMLLLAKPKHAARAQHGYVRGSEAVRYVRGIRDRYDAYTRRAESGAAIVAEEPTG